MHTHHEYAHEKASNQTRNAVTPMHVCLILDNNALTETVVQALDRGGRHRVTVLHDITDLTQSALTPDAILIGLQQFTALRENEPMVYLRLSRRSRIVVVLSSRELLDAAHILAFADAWVFEDLNVDRINELLDLGLEGHCLMPKQFLSRLGVDEIRLSLLPRLSDPEYETLRLLGQGLNNRTIANALDLSEAVIKSMVRSVLSKLHFRNRTEAGVFAARQQGALQSARDGVVPPHMHAAQQQRAAGA
ncbi:DNA-binding NarL/FixJ family response regulator [Azospirillum agricola]|uniref:response regulator transcription factor n=1 Tax=Azospirillum agricola TaxID=1720247 RepID=UPI001F25FC9C|nr:LuxR C-terminal-related transcriptional regulator [Azospirillum agricola]MBP2227447.1 DNA-binding NarL/FixJ family response regulator [Azospirillum agricola]